MREPDLPYVVCSVDPKTGNRLEIFAKTQSLKFARVAYRMICEERPGELIRLQNKALILTQSDRD